MVLHGFSQDTTHLSTFFRTRVYLKEDIQISEEYYKGHMNTFKLNAYVVTEEAYNSKNWLNKWYKSLSLIIIN